MKHLRIDATGWRQEEHCSISGVIHRFLKSNTPFQRIRLALSFDIIHEILTKYPYGFRA